MSADTAFIPGTIARTLVDNLIRSYPPCPYTDKHACTAPCLSDNWLKSLWRPLLSICRYRSKQTAYYAVVSGSSCRCNSILFVQKVLLSDWLSWRELTPQCTAGNQYWPNWWDFSFFFYLVAQLIARHLTRVWFAWPSKVESWAKNTVRLFLWKNSATVARLLTVSEVSNSKVAVKTIICSKAQTAIETICMMLTWKEPESSIPDIIWIFECFPSLTVVGLHISYKALCIHVILILFSPPAFMNYPNKPNLRKTI